MSDKPKLRESLQNHWLVIFKTAKVMKDKKKHWRKKTHCSQNNMKNKEKFFSGWRRRKTQDRETKCLMLDAVWEKGCLMGEVWIMVLDKITLWITINILIGKIMPWLYKRIFYLYRYRDIILYFQLKLFFFPLRKRESEKKYDKMLTFGESEWRVYR